MKSELFATLPDVVFAERDPAVIERELIRGYENAYQLKYGKERKLYPGDPVRLLLESVAFELVHQRQIIDYTGKMNLLAYAEGEHIDHLGALLGVTRLPAQPALTTLKFKLSETQSGVSIIPEGTRATPGGGDIAFATSEAVQVQAGESEIEVTAHCLVVGTSGNGFLPGQVRKIIDPFPWQTSVENVTATYGGTDVESDENLRERIQLAPESFSNAGSRGAYIFWARSASQLIVDVELHSPEPGVVHIYPLLAGGALPGPELLAKVLTVCNADTVRPMTDHVFALPPVPVAFGLRVTWYLERANAAAATAIDRAVRQAVDSWLLWQRTKLGRDINPSELVRRMVSAGAKRVIVASPGFTILDFNQVGVAVSENIVFGGLEDG